MFNNNYNITPSTSKKLKSNSCGRPKKPIWRFFEQGDEVDKGHYIATCLACNQTFQPGRTTIMEKHVIDNCLKVDHSIREAVKYMIETREESFSNSTSTKRKGSQVENDQTTLVNFYENSDLGIERKGVIDVALIKAFVCYGLPWHLIEHPFFVELLKQL